MDISARLNRAMFLKEIRPIDLAERTGISKGLISRYINKGGMPSSKNLSLIADALGVTSDWLLGKEEMAEARLALPENKVPILGRVAAGVPIYAMQDVVGSVVVDQNPEGMFALRVKGDSMSPRIMDGDLVLVRAQKSAEDGDLVIALVDDEATCKILHRSAWGVTLLPFNPAFPPFAFAGEEADRIQIIGKVVESRHDWER